MAVDKPAIEASFTLAPMTNGPNDKHNFGAIATGLDLDSISGASPYMYRDMKPQRHV